MLTQRVLYLKLNIKSAKSLFFMSAILIFMMQSMVLAEEKNKTLKSAELVEIIKLDDSIKLDIIYATKHNFLSRSVYKEAKAFLQKPVAEDLVKVNKDLKKTGLGLRVFDGYRPWSVTKIFWDETPEEKRKFVADPKIGSIHNRGCAVDLTLYDLKTEKNLDMPSEYDEFSERAYSNYSGGTKEQRKNRDLLISQMKNHGFSVYEYEWWHFNHKDCDKYQILDLRFDEIS